MPARVSERERAKGSELAGKSAACEGFVQDFQRFLFKFQFAVNAKQCWLTL